MLVQKQPLINEDVDTSELFDKMIEILQTNKDLHKYFNYDYENLLNLTLGTKLNRKSKLYNYFIKL